MESIKLDTRLPHWDMTVVYPGLESVEFKQAFASTLQSLADLSRLFDECGVARPEHAPALDATLLQTVDRVITRLNAVLDQVHTVHAYITSFVATDSRNVLAQAKLSELQQQLTRLWQLRTRFTAWMGSMDVEGIIAQSSIARDHSFLLRQSKIEAAHLMSPPEEELAIELNVSSGAAWEKLHSDMSSQLLVPLAGEIKPLPMSAIRARAFDPDREVRRRAYEAELSAWERAAVPLAAALNGIKGEMNTLARRRGWDSALDAAIFESHIDRQTLEALLQAARESFPDWRRYLHAKARALGVARLAWYDLFAPVGQGRRVWEYPEATRFLAEQFGAYSPRLRGLAERAFRENWIDAEPRPGKQDGAFCMLVRGEESRVLANYKRAYGGMSTLAHELGHAYHNLVKAPRTMLQRETPMTLAETASIFCETIVRGAALKTADRAEQLAILEASLQDNCQVVVDIYSRFIFEQRVFERRLMRELSVDEFNQLMIEAQKETYGEGLDPQQLHPYMWAVKSHYYDTGRSFYNFPYLFGLLFGLGLYRRYQQAPEEFKQSYDDLLSSTGMADAATLAARFGIDLRTPDFWRASLDVIRADIRQFESLIAAQ